MDKPKTVAVTAVEGGEWIEFEQPDGSCESCPGHCFRRCYLKPPVPTAVHSIKFADGSEWDAVNGWRQKKCVIDGTGWAEAVFDNGQPMARSEFYSWVRSA